MLVKHRSRPEGLSFDFLITDDGIRRLSGPMKTVLAGPSMVTVSPNLMVSGPPLVSTRTASPIFPR